MSSKTSPTLYWLVLQHNQQSENAKVINGAEIEKQGSRGSKWASHQSQNSIFALEVDGDIWLDEVAGQHGDPDAQVGWSSRLRMGTKLEWQPCCCNGNYTGLINIILIKRGDVHRRWSVGKI